MQAIDNFTQTLKSRPNKFSGQDLESAMRLGEKKKDGVIWIIYTLFNSDRE